MNTALLGNWIGLALWSVCLGIVFQRVPRPRPDQRDLRRPLSLVMWAALVPLAFLARGIFGELSLAAPVLVFWLTRRPALPAGTRRIVALLAAAGIVLAASALGWIETDLYAYGYALGADSPALPYALGVILLAAWLWARPLAWSWLLGLCLFALHLLPSPNVWDALIDFPSTLIAAALVVREALQAARARRSAPC